MSEGLSSQNSSDLLGTVEVTFSVTHRLALSRATEGWSAEECAALRDGNTDAREALVDAVWTDGTRQGFDDVDDGFVDLRIDNASKEWKR